MSSEKILDVIFEARQNQLLKKESMVNDKILKKREAFTEFLKKEIKDEELRYKIESLSEEVDLEFLEENEKCCKKYYEYGINDMLKLLKEARAVESAQDTKDKEDLFEQWYEIRIDLVASLTESEKEKLSEYSEKLDVYKEFTDFSEEDKKRIFDFAERVKEKDSLEMGYYCNKYYKFGFRDCKNLMSNL